MTVYHYKQSHKHILRNCLYFNTNYLLIDVGTKIAYIILTDAFSKMI